VRLSQLPWVAIKDVADSLCIHPFMLSLWRKRAKEGLIVTKSVSVDKDVAAEFKELRRVSTTVLKRDRLHFRTKSEIFAYIQSQQGEHSVRRMCRIFDVSSSGYYARIGQPMSKRAQGDQILSKQVRHTHQSSDQTHGSSRTHAQLIRENESSA
jgi:hypothetical protein